MKKSPRQVGLKHTTLHVGAPLDEWIFSSSSSSLFYIIRWHIWNVASWHHLPPSQRTHFLFWSPNFLFLQIEIVFYATKFGRCRKIQDDVPLIRKIPNIGYNIKATRFAIFILTCFISLLSVCIPTSKSEIARSPNPSPWWHHIREYGHSGRCPGKRESLPSTLKDLWKIIEDYPGVPARSLYDLIWKKEKCQNMKE